jgi:hypothetical protein
MRNNTFSVAIIVVIVFVAVIAYITVWPWLMIFLGNSLLPNPPRPEITYGEFPFRLEYEINGQRMVIQDTLICEYDGIGMDEGNGKYRNWKEHLASGNEKLVLLKVEGTKEIYYYPGSAQYYMGDMNEGVTYSHGFPKARYFEIYADGSTSDGIIQADELLNKYNIRLISWDYTPPIKNNFSTTKK